MGIESLKSWAVMAALLAVTGAASCRRYNPIPNDAGVTPPDVVINTGGTGGRSPGTGGAPADVRPPDVDPPDLAAPDLGPACGKTAQACCPGNRCLEGGCCEEGICTSHGNSCQLEPSASCLNSKCSTDCGGPGIRCCGGPRRNCTFPLTICEGPGLGVCVACGGFGQPCCRDKYCDKNVMCNAAGRCGGPDAGVDAASDAPKDGPVDAPKG